MSSTRRQNSVKSLTSLYTVVIGVALSLAVVQLFDTEKGLDVGSLPAIPTFIAFIVTLFPFYHGALRHIDDAYIEQSNHHIRDGALIFDFLLLFLHAIVFVLLALLIDKPGQFAWVLTAILTIDFIWAIFAHFASSSRTSVRAEGRWAIINFCFVGVMLVYLISTGSYLREVDNPLALSVLLLFGTCVRSFADYAWCYAFYFPPDEDAPATDGPVMSPQSPSSDPDKKG